MTSIPRLDDSLAPTPEHALWLAVLEQALRDAFDGADELAREEARRWLTDGSSDLHLVCGLLGIDAGRLSRYMRSVAERDGWFGGADADPPPIVPTAIPAAAA